ncbi:glycosyltransferase family 87 protein [Streptomyces sp. WMMB 322]|uniref:glycosyltransferase family 87 protein n=1 Tax=Streptomyces sp. WMMB 322 TaxID=1286821 RepID=UPI00099E8831|nr:glycosyltransferase family 87 protein [Streptomyces sp. WMMB 322]
MTDSTAAPAPREAEAGAPRDESGRRGTKRGSHRRRGSRLRSAAPVVAVWAVTRAALLLCVFKVVTLPGPDFTNDVNVIYRGWYEVLRSGVFPENDVTWQYPPAAALAILSPALLSFLDYASAFYLLALAADAVTFGLLLRTSARPGRSRAGVWSWVAGVALLGPTAYARYDLMVTAVAVGALLAGARHPRAAGALAAFGALVKVWPALLLLGTPRGRRTRTAWTAALITGVAVAGLFAATMPGAFAFLEFQQDRGTEVESLGALALHVARQFGWEGQVLLNYGSMEFVGPYVHLVSDAALVLTLFAFAWLLTWRLRAVEWTSSTPADAALTAVLLFVTTSRVISPQYMIWLVGVAAVCLTLRAGCQGLPAVLVLGATAVTLLEFPLGFAHVVASDWLGLVLMAVRNGLLVAASLLACVRLWRSTRPAVDGTAEDVTTPPSARTRATSP